ncbi:hypothetical protein Nepgr_009393 [Nepenthes gracilis]|uniref:Uncharacterized protein n=1 Tax=Nepenthes gracilis TaxID=150966 RepID=A0AAD3SAI4_NEPGR|nr:hypothetical protein Nepgr_009393 [Nepenthes gracilis]
MLVSQNSLLPCYDAVCIADRPILSLSVGCNTPNSCLPIGPSYAEILCCGIDADPPGFLVGGEACWPISEEDRIAALGLVGAPLPLVLEQASGLVSYPPGPHDLAGDLVNTPPSISRIITKYSLDTSYQLGHGSSSPKGLSAASSTDSHLDTSEIYGAAPADLYSVIGACDCFLECSMPSRLLALVLMLDGHFGCQSMATINGDWCAFLLVLSSATLG